MSWSTIDSVGEDLVIGAISGLISTGLVLLYQRWQRGWVRLPFPIVHTEIPDPMIQSNFTERLSVHNPTSVTVGFLLTLQLESGKQAYPRQIIATGENIKEITGWAAVPPGDTRDFEMYPGAYGEPKIGAHLQVHGPFARRGREKVTLFDPPFPPGAPAIIRHR